jgi:hypothetical protein
MEMRTSDLSALAPAFVPRSVTRCGAGTRDAWITKSQRQALKGALAAAGTYVDLEAIVAASNAAVLSARRVKHQRLLPDIGAVRAYVEWKVAAQSYWAETTGAMLVLPVADDVPGSKGAMHAGYYLAGGVWDVRADGAVRYAVTKSLAEGPWNARRASR